jgi:adenylate cyclase
MTSRLRRIPFNLLIALALLLASVALRIADPGPVARLRLSVFDTYLRAAPRLVDTSFPVRVVAIDEASLAHVGQWPWPRTKLAELVSRLRDAGAKAIAFDLIFAEPDRLSPDQLLHSLDDRNVSGDLVAELGKLPSNDERLAKAIASAPTVLSVAGDVHGTHPIAAYRGALSYAGDNPAEFVRAFSGGVGNLPGLTAAAMGVGAVNWVPSDDQIVRRVPLLVSIAGTLYPSLPVEALRVGTKQSTIFVKSSGGSGVYAFGEKTGIESVRVGNVILPSDQHGELWLKFSRSEPRRTISADSILAGTFDRAEIKSRYVLIGATAAGLLDLRATPLEPSVAGVEVHAQALEQMLSGDNPVRPAYATGAEIAFLIAIGALVAWLISRSGAIIAAIVGGVAIAAIVLLSWVAYSRAGLLLDPIYPSLSVALLYLGCSLTSYVRSEIQRAQIRSAFGHYVAPTLVAEIARNYDDLKLGGERREVSLLFADVRGFSRLSEGMQAEDLVGFVNWLFTPMAETILAHRGTIDKFMGDAVMAFWNAPLKDPEHAKNACRAALAMLEALSQLNASRDDECKLHGMAFSPVRLGIGLNTGICVVGNVGSPQRFDYSVLGDVVNSAARFEEATKTFGADIIVGDRTAAAASNFALLELGTVVLRGKDRPERIFALLGDETMAASEAFSELECAHRRLLEAGHDERALLSALEDCRKISMPGLAQYYRDFLTRSPAIGKASDPALGPSP